MQDIIGVLQTGQHQSTEGSRFWTFGLAAGYLLGIASTVIFSCLFRSKPRSRAYREIPATSSMDTGAFPLELKNPRTSEHSLAKPGGAWSVTIKTQPPIEQQHPPNTGAWQTSALKIGVLKDSVIINDTISQRDKMNVSTSTARFNTAVLATSPKGRPTAGISIGINAEELETNTRLTQDQIFQPAQLQSGSRIDKKELCPTDDDLDDDWKCLLSELDEMIARQGESRMTLPERNLAIRKAFAMTGSQGPAFALSSVKDIILKARNPAPKILAFNDQHHNTQLVTEHTKPQYPHQHAASGVDIQDLYDDSDLDDDWRALLSELDEMLLEKGQPRMSVQERSIAIKKLVQLTGTRGPVYALTTARDIVLRSRNPFA